jgi:hypothetical protein
MLMVGNGRPGLLAKLGRSIEGDVAGKLARMQSSPVVVVPEHPAHR